MITKNIKKDIEEFFFMNPSRKLRVRHIERVVGVPLPSAIRYAKELTNENVLQEIKMENIKFYTADRSSNEFLLRKKLFNIKKLYECGLVDFLIEQYSNSAITLFGSFSRGEDTEDSDVDLFIQTVSKKNIELSKFGKKLDRNIQLFVHKNIKDVKNKELMNNIVNGMSLNGNLEVFS